MKDSRFSLDKSTRGDLAGRQSDGTPLSRLMSFRIGVVKLVRRVEREELPLLELPAEARDVTSEACSSKAMIGVTSAGARLCRGMLSQ